MSRFYSDAIADARKGLIGSNILFAGTMKGVSFSFTTPAAGLSISDIIEIGLMPQGSVPAADLGWTDFEAMGAGATCRFGTEDQPDIFNIGGSAQDVSAAVNIPGWPSRSSEGAANIGNIIIKGTFQDGVVNPLSKAVKVILTVAGANWDGNKRVTGQFYYMVP